MFGSAIAYCDTVLEWNGSAHKGRGGDQCRFKDGEGTGQWGGVQREREGDGHHGSPKREKEAALERTQRGR